MPLLLKDLRGVKCPMNFIKAKLFLEGTSNEEVIFLLDDNESIDNVPYSLEQEGHEIIDSNLKKNSDDEIYWELKVKK